MCVGVNKVASVSVSVCLSACFSLVLSFCQVTFCPTLSVRWCVQLRLSDPFADQIWNYCTHGGCGLTFVSREARDNVKQYFVVVVFNLCVNIWNRMMPKAPVQNQRTSELISVWKASHKHNSKDLLCLLLLSPGTRVNTRHIHCTRGTSSSGVYVPCIYSHARWGTAGDLGLVAVVRWCFSSAS